MELKPAKFEKIVKEVEVRISDEVYGCDECRTEIDREKSYLEATIFQQEGDSEHRQYCSWKCVVKNLRKVKSDYFVSLPFLHYDQKQKGLRAKDFFALFTFKASS